MTHILIADDDKFLTSICARAFEQAGYKTSVAHDGHQASHLLVADRPDLILLDLQLPGIDGIGVLKFIRARPDLKDLPVFILSNSEHFSGLVQTAWSEGATNFMRKGELGPAEIVEEIAKTVPPTDYIASPSPPDLPIDYQTAPAAKSAPVGGALPKSVLIADDDRTIHGVLAFFFGQAGFKVSSAFNGTDALEMARAQKPGVLVLDVTMPVKGGFETLAEWELDPDLKAIPVIMLSASTDEQNQGKAVGEGAARYLTKPFSPESLVNLATELIGG